MTLSQENIFPCVKPVRKLRPQTSSPGVRLASAADRTGSAPRPDTDPNARLGVCNEGRVHDTVDAPDAMEFALETGKSYRR